MADLLAALRERVLIFDGAFGTWVQDRDLYFKITILHRYPVKLIRIG